jgi:hypothetical protein
MLTRLPPSNACVDNNLYQPAGKMLDRSFTETVKGVSAESCECPRDEIQDEGRDKVVPGCEAEITVPHEEEDEEDGSEEVGRFEKFVVAIPINVLVDFIEVSTNEKRWILYRIGPIDKMVNQACGTKAATPVQ